MWKHHDSKYLLTDSPFLLLLLLVIVLPIHLNRYETSKHRARGRQSKRWKLKINDKIKWQRSDTYKYVKQQMTFFFLLSIRWVCSLSICSWLTLELCLYVNVWQNIKYIHVCPKPFFNVISKLFADLFNSNDHWTQYLNAVDSNMGIW